MSMLRRIFCFVLFIAACAQAAESVIVTKKDGKKQMGELTLVDPDKVILKDADEKNIEIPWADIQKMSNGLNRESGTKRWKEENAERLCATCHGERFVECLKCKGTGKDPVAKVACKTCQGTGSTKCTVKSCVNGVADCPNTCLKLSEGTWYEEGGKKWRKFTTSKFVASWSDGHLGQVIVIKDGLPTNTGVCPVCMGKTKVQCMLCKGTGTVACAECQGTKQVPADCEACKGGTVRTPCATCKGTGLKP